MTNINSNQQVIHLALPKGRIENAVLTLMSDAGLEVLSGGRSYRPRLTTTPAAA